ncbi:MAG: nucleoside deaminase [Clostridiales bacterium]|nr:nucleoside deaminase [Clostridiales bacterium]
MTHFENRFMRLALDEAQLAFQHGDIPVGAVIVCNNNIVARTHNTRECNKNALEHAEISAISAACKKLGRWRLSDCDIYVTLEPCLMCTGAIIQSRIRRVYFGAYDSELGFVASNEALKPHIKFEYYCGIMEDECKSLIDKFFRQIRK